MDYPWTLALLLTGAAAFAGATWRARRAREVFEVPLVPYGAVQFVALVLVVVMLAHLVTLASGQPFAGRLGG